MSSNGTLALQPGAEPLLTFEHAWLTNQLLRSLGPQGIEQVASSVEMVHGKTGQVVGDVGVTPEHVYFPVTAVVSVRRRVGPAKHMEVASIGREGMSGLTLYLGAPQATRRTEVVMAGSLARMPVATFQAAASRHAAFRGAVDSYAARVITEMERLLLCARLHSVSEQLSGWLLRNATRTGKDDFELTHGQLAALLGVRRATVSEAIGRLGRERVLQCGRARMTILCRDALSANACGCHQDLE